MKVKLSWVKSVSAGVVSQELKSVVNGDAVDTQVLGADVESMIYTLVEGDRLDVTLRAYNGVKYSAAVVGNFAVPVVPAPEAPTNLTFEVVEE